jgi:uncharacterized protein YdaU (DUF1376 family)
VKHFFLPRPSLKSFRRTGGGAGALHISPPPFSGAHLVRRCITNYIPWYPGDYLRDTLHLTWLEDLAYRRLLEIYYSTETAIPGDEERIFSMVRAVTRDQQESVRKILKEFFRFSRGKWVNSRADLELKKRDAWRERKQKQRDKDKNVTHNVTQSVTPLSHRSPSPSPSPTKTIKTPLPPLPRGNQNGEVCFPWAGEHVVVNMGRRRRLPGLTAYHGAQAGAVAAFLTRKGFPARVIRKGETHD